MPSSDDVHVSKDENGGWKKTVGGEKVGHAHQTQQGAIDAAEKIARKNESDLVVHGRDGKIRSKDSFGNDPKSIKDTEHRGELSAPPRWRSTGCFVGRL